MEEEQKYSWLGYLFAVVLGAVIVAVNFPLGAIVGRLPGSLAAMGGDFQQHVIGQLYFLQQPWSWDLLFAKKLDAPYGVNIAMTDSIPLEAILLKILHPLFPDVQQGVSIFLALCWFLQPVTAVFAIRAAGCRRLLTDISAALFASFLPTFLNRFGHVALSAHWLFLLSVGLYFQSVRVERNTVYVWLFALVNVLSFLIHPYLMLMITVMYLAVPLTTYLKSRKRENVISYCIPNICAFFVIVCLWFVLHYRGVSGGGGFGLYSMNIISPFWPSQSSIFPGFSGGIADATGGQGFEGYQYLGAGLLLLIFSVVCVKRGRALICDAWKKHPGVVVACALLTMLALSSDVYLFHIRLLHIPVRHLFKQFRSSGRFFWPVAYFIIVGTVYSVSKVYPKIGAFLLIVCAVLQWGDTRGIRENLRKSLVMFDESEATLVDKKIDGIMSGFQNLKIYPRLECVGGVPDHHLKYLYVAATKNMSTNTMYLARTSKALKCNEERDKPGAIGEGDLIIFLGAEGRKLLGAIPQGKEPIFCQAINAEDVACSRRKLDE